METTWPLAVVVVAVVVFVIALRHVAGLCRMALREGAKFTAGVDVPSLIRVYYRIEPQAEKEPPQPHSLAGESGSAMDDD